MKNLRKEIRKENFLNKTYLDDNDITDLLCVSQRTLNNKVYRGDDLPEFIKLPGCRKRIWPAESVKEWLFASRNEADK